MFVRAVTFEGGDTERVNQMTQELRASGEMTLPEGISRVLVLDGEGRRLVLFFFESREQIEAAQSQFEAMGDKIPEEARGRRVSVDVYEVTSDEDVRGGSSAPG